jgi:hypothetical protein
MSGLPNSLAIAIWLVAAMWIVGLLAYYFDYPTDLIWLVLLLGIGAAMAEWRMIRGERS